MSSTRIPVRKTRKPFPALPRTLCLGPLGIDRFYLGYTGLGLIKLATCGGGGTRWLLDRFLILAGKLKDIDGYPLADS